MAYDPAIITIFGYPPDGLDLNSEVTTRYNIVMGCMLALACFIVALRVWVRLDRSNLWYDDYAVILALFVTSATIATSIIAGKRGAGEHIWNSTLERFVGLLKVVYAEPYVYALAVTTSKVSVLLLYRRVFHVRSGVSVTLFKYMFALASFMTGSYPLILWITMACACQPISFYWNQYLGAHGSCINVELFFLVLGIVNMINDVIILTVPIPMILSLKMNSAMKISVLSVMMLGGIVCVASIFRIYYLNGLFKSVDVSWWMGPSFAWSSIEPLVAIIAACLPTLAPLFRAIHLKTSSNGSGGNSGGPYIQSGSHHLSSHNNRGRHNITGASRGGASGDHLRNDDEIELTCAIEGGHPSAAATARGSTRSEVAATETTQSKGGGSSDGEDDRQIHVWTQVSVAHEKR